MRLTPLNNFYLPVFLLFSFFVAKSLYTLLLFHMWIETAHYFYILTLRSFQNDLLLLLPLVGVLFLFEKVSICKRCIFFLSLIYALLVIVVSYIDIQTLFTFNRRLSLVDTVRFSNHGVENQFISIYLLNFLSLAFITAGLTYIFSKLKSSFFIIALLSAVILLLPTKLKYFKTDYITNNFFQNNTDFSFAKKVPNLSKKEEQFLKHFHYQKGDEDNGSLIVIFAESWSFSDSMHFSGLTKDNLPLYDKVSKEGKSFVNFFAEGSTTDQAYIALFSGLPPLLYNFSDDTYSAYAFQNPFISSLNKAGYETIFLKAYSLDFLNLREYLKQLGFKKMYGKDELFNTPPFYTMNTVPDTTLYDKALEIISKEQKEGKKFTLFLTTISTHIPYYVPEGTTQKAAYNFSDKAFYDFYRKLKTNGYLKNNYLLLFGDHRKMTPLDPGEYEKFGKSAYGRIVCSLWGKNIKPEMEKAYFNQSDITYSILKKFTAKALLPDNYNDIFSGKIKRGYAVHDTFADRNEIFVFPKTYTEKAQKYIKQVRGHYQYQVQQHK